MKNDLRDILLLIHVTSAIISLTFPIVMAVSSCRLYFELKKIGLSLSSFNFFKSKSKYLSRVTYLLPITGVVIVVLSNFKSSFFWVYIGALCWIINVLLIEIGVLRPWNKVCLNLNSLSTQMFQVGKSSESFEDEVKLQNTSGALATLDFKLNDENRFLNLVRNVKSMIICSSVAFVVLFAALYVMIRQP